MRIDERYQLLQLIQQGEKEETWLFSCKTSEAGSKEQPLNSTGIYTESIRTMRRRVDRPAGREALLDSDMIWFYS